MAEFELYKDSAGEFRWRLRANNGKVIATSGEGYKAHGDCKRGIELVRQQAPEAKLDEQT
ncbi:MAG TPA: DUF1508 domain-containing protein [Patescibacteria group bacterium]|nr:DUF1508 domain-containing protein [Patescibacteria group bacterium]